MLAAAFVCRPGELVAMSVPHTQNVMSEKSSVLGCDPWELQGWETVRRRLPFLSPTVLPSPGCTSRWDISSGPRMQVYCPCVIGLSKEQGPAALGDQEQRAPEGCQAVLHSSPQNEGISQPGFK